jgi:hypothetical protein
MTQEALKLALEWAEANGEIVFAGGGMDAVNKMNSWATAIKEALAQPEQEPVALEAVYETIIQWDEGGGKRSRRELARRIVALYTTPPAISIPRKGCQYLSAADRVCNKCGEIHRVDRLIDFLRPQPPQRKWVGLTDEDRKQISKEANYHWEMTAGEYAERIGQLTEAKLKEKNT